MNLFFRCIVTIVSVMIVLSQTSNKSMYSTIDRKQYYVDLENNSIIEKFTPSSLNLPYNDIEMSISASEYLEQNRYEDAIDIYQSELIRNPKDPWLLCSIAKIYCDYMDDYEKAFSLYKEAYTYSPNNPIAIVGYGYIQLVLKNYESSLFLLNEFISKCDFDNPIDQTYAIEAFGIIAEAAYNVGDGNAISNALQSLLQLDKNDLSVFIGVMHAYNIQIIYCYANKEYDKLLLYIKEYEIFLDSSEYNKLSLRQLYDTCWSVELFDYCEELKQMLIGVL